MVALYAMRIQAGKMVLDDVPSRWWDQVIEKLDKRKGK